MRNHAYILVCVYIYIYTYGDRQADSKLSYVHAVLGSDDQHLLRLSVNLIPGITLPHPTPEF